MPAAATWKIHNLGDVPEDSTELEFDCPGCGRPALLPYTGQPLAQFGGGIVFDTTRHALPVDIECRACRRRFVTDSKA